MNAGTASRTRGPTCSASFAYGLPEFFRDDDQGLQARRRAGLLPDRRQPGAAARWSTPA